MASQSNFSRILAERRYTLLLLALIIMALLQPLAQGMLYGVQLYDVVFGFIVLAVFVIVFERTHERWISLILALLAVVLRLASHLLDDPWRFYAVALHHVLLMVFFGLVVCVILWRIFEKQTIQSDHMIGTICGYLLAGAAWGSCYSLCEQVLPGSFRVDPKIVGRLDEEHSRRFIFNYFSLCTITGASYGDITPIRPAVASLTWLEAMFGQFYIAVVVAQLVGLRLAQAMDSGKKIETSG